MSTSISLYLSISPQRVLYITIGENKNVSCSFLNRNTKISLLLDKPVHFFPYNSCIIENSKQFTGIKNFYLIVKESLTHVSIGHKQHMEVKSKWHEQETSLDFKSGQIKFHHVMVADQFN